MYHPKLGGELCKQDELLSMNFITRSIIIKELGHHKMGNDLIQDSRYKIHLTNRRFSLSLIGYFEECTSEVGWQIDQAYTPTSIIVKSLPINALLIQKFECPL
jgi:hypothetical protein